MPCVPIPSSHRVDADMRGREREENLTSNNSNNKSSLQTWHQYLPLIFYVIQITFYCHFSALQQIQKNINQMHNMEKEMSEKRVRREREREREGYHEYLYSN